MRGLYVHLPFCQQKCPYCGFYSEAGKDDEVIKKYLNACIFEISSLENKNFDTIYFGGGTPSSINGKLLENFTENIFNIIKFSGKEFSIEANPESVTTDFTAFVKSSPITRVSLGIQSFNDDVLAKLGRLHNGVKAFKAAETLINTGVSVNLDMIFDIPDVPINIIKETADLITSLNPSHISAYSYSSEDTGFLSGFDTDKTQYEYVAELLEEKGYGKYEISNFAKQCKESLHNIIYWTMDEYRGIGASAHSMFYGSTGTRIRYSRVKSIESYINNPIGYEFYEELDTETAIKESIVFGLRMKKGVNMAVIEKMFGKLEPNLINSIEKHIGQGLLLWNSEYLKTTERGELVLDSLSLRLWAD